MADDPRGWSRPCVAAGMLFFDDAGRVMLVEPNYKDHWEIPGGFVETGETPVQACLREIREELGIEVAVGPLLVADWAPNPDEGDKLLLVFDGGILTGDQLALVRLPADELTSYAFREPAAAIELLIPRLGRRIVAAIEARNTGRPAYLEHGVPSTC